MYIIGKERQFYREILSIGLPSISGNTAGEDIESKLTFKSIEKELGRFGISVPSDFEAKLEKTLETGKGPYKTHGITKRVIRGIVTAVYYIAGQRSEEEINEIVSTFLLDYAKIECCVASTDPDRSAFLGKKVKGFTGTAPYRKVRVTREGVCCFDA